MVEVLANVSAPTRKRRNVEKTSALISRSEWFERVGTAAREGSGSRPRGRPFPDSSKADLPFPHEKLNEMAGCGD